MVKKRIIPKFLIKDGRLVKAIRFHENYREAGNPLTTAKVYDSYGVDELIFLDIHASIESRNTILEIIEKISCEVFMPFTVGGGIRTLDDINNLLRAGADKVSINTSAIENPDFIKTSASKFGDQCIVVSIDYREITPGVFNVFSHAGMNKTELNPLEWALRMQDNNCGEILLCSIDRDGTMSGYDLDMIAQLTEKLNVPLIASSGAGSLLDCIEAFNSGASAITISSMFIFTDHSPIKVRSQLWSNNIDVRASTSSRN